MDSGTATGPAPGGSVGDFGLAAASAAAGAGPGASPSPFQQAAARLPGLIERAKNIILTPTTEWIVIQAEPTSPSQLYSGYVMPMAGFAALMSFLRMSVVGVPVPFGGTIRTPFLSGLVSSAVTFVLGLIGLYLVGLIINMLAPTFSGVRDQRQALKTAAYALTPAWLGTALSFLPLGYLLQLCAGIYGIYVLYLGLPVMMKAPQDKAGGYTALTVVCTIVLGILFGVAGGMLSGMGRVGTGFAAGVYSPRNHESAAERIAASVAAATSAAAGSTMSSTTSSTGNAPAGSTQAAANDGASPKDAAAAGAAVGSLIGALGGALGGEVHHEPIDFNVLKDMLPASLPQMERTDAQGSTQQAMGVKSSSATANYHGTSSDTPSHVSVKISDIAGVSGLLDAASGFMPTGETQTDTGFEKDMVVGGRMIHEKYDRRSRDGEITAIVAKRFSIEVSGQGVEIEQLEKILAGIDLARLESLKNAGAQPN